MSKKAFPNSRHLATQDRFSKLNVAATDAANVISKFLHTAYTGALTEEDRNIMIAASNIASAVRAKSTVHDCYEYIKNNPDEFE